MGTIAWLLAYAAGLACAPMLAPGILLFLLPFAAGLLWLACRNRRAAPALLLIFFFGLALPLYHLDLAPPNDPTHIRSFAGDLPLTVEGRVLSVAARPEGGTRLDLETSLAGRNGIVAPVRGRLRLYLDQEQPPHPGDRIRFSSRLRLPRRFGTPGEFDYPRHLAQQEIFASAHLLAARELVVFARPSSGGGIEGVRAALGRFIAARLPPERASLVRALVLGDSGGITPALRDLLARGGVAHLFAISGLHFGLLAGFLFAAGLFLWRRSETLLLFAPPRRWLPPLLLPPLAFYLLLTGSALPTRRAFLVAALGAGLLLWGRRTRPLDLLATVALLLLLESPLALFAPSFQLSFAGVLGIILFVPRWQPRLQSAPPPLRWAALLALTTLAATIATAPLTLHHFHMLSPAGLLTNLFAVPAVSLLSVPLGLAGTLLLPLWPDAAALLLQGCGAATSAVLAAVAKVVAVPPLSGWWLYQPTTTTLAAALFAAAVLLPPLPARRGLRPVLAVAAGLLLCLPSAAPPGLTVTALSVGQGEALLLTRPDGRHYLVDGGGLPGAGFDVGRRLLAPALGRLGVRSLEAVILTHDHPDHRDGLLHVLEHFPVGAFWSARTPEELDPALAEILRRRAIPTRRFLPGWTFLRAAEDETFALHGPLEDATGNDSSLVVYARFGADGALLTGDLERAGVEELLSNPLPGPVGLLKLPHHGSRHSEPLRMVDQFRPRMALISAGAGNPLNLPHPTVVAALDERGIEVRRTDRDGSCRCRSTGDGWRGEVWRQGLFR